MHLLRSRIRSGSWVALALVGALLVATAAGAVIIKGRGELRATGNGTVVLKLRGVATVQGFGLAVVEREAIVELDGHGRTTPVGEGRVLLEGFGRFKVRSLREPTRVEAAGARLRLRARGVGVAILKGVGSISTDEHDGLWGDEVTVELEGDE